MNTFEIVPLGLYVETSNPSLDWMHWWVFLKSSDSNSYKNGKNVQEKELQWLKLGRVPEPENSRKPTTAFWLFLHSHTQKKGKLPFSSLPLLLNILEINVNLSVFKIHLDFSYKLKIFNGEGNGNPLQYSCLENPMEGGAWWATVHGVAKSRIRLSDFTFLLSQETTNNKNFWADFHDIN